MKNNNNVRTKMAHVRIGRDKKTEKCVMQVAMNLNSETRLIVVVSTVSLFAKS